MKKLFTLALVCMLALSSYAQGLGEVDTSFGTDGSFVFDPSEKHDFVYKVLVQEDGKILTIGEARTDGYNYAIYVSRHNVDGSFDETYGDGGIVFLKVDPLIFKNCPYDAVLSEDGLLYLAGYAYNGLNAGFILCLDENGFENEEFGEGGWVVTELDEFGLVYEAIDIDAKGRCVVAGYYNDEIIVKRYNAKGAPDISFGDKGIVALELDSSPSAHSYAYDIKVLDNGKIIVVGDMRTSSDDGLFIYSYILRLRSNGSLDGTFGENGVLYLYAGEYAEFALSVAVQPDGKYLVGGHNELYSNTPQMPRYESFVVRVNTNGTIDETFGTDGFVKIEPFEGDGCTNNSYSILVASDGQIFGGVYSNNRATNAFRGYVYNLDANGQYNEEFAGTGLMALPVVDQAQEELNVYSIALQGNDKLIVGGYIGFDDGEYTKIYLTRVNVNVEGGEVENPLAKVTVDAEVTDANTIKATFTPDENTVEYHVGVYTQEAYAQAAENELADALKADGKALTGNQELTFGELIPETEYVILVVAKNAANEWNVQETYVVTPKAEGLAENKTGYNIYPNPATSTLFIETSNGNAHVSIIDLTGRCVKETEITKTVSSINIEDVENGVYFISITNGDNNTVEKLVIK